MNFMPIHNSYTRNGDHLTFFIKTGDAHKKSCHKLSLILMRDGHEHKRAMRFSYFESREHISYI